MGVVEGSIVDLQHGSQRRVERPSIGHKLGLVKHLEATDGAERDYQENSRAQERHGDIPERLEAIGTVNRGGLNQLSRQILQGCHKVDHEARGSGPDIEEHQRRQGEEWIVQPVRPADMYHREEIVDKAVRIVEPEKDEGCGY